MAEQKNPFLDKLKEELGKLGTQAQALYRQGATDLLNAVWGQNLAREAGAPGEPTQQIVTEGLTGQEVNKSTDTIDRGAWGAKLAEEAKAPPQEQKTQDNERVRQNEGRSR